MPATALASRTPPGQLRAARRRLLDCGELSQGLLDPTLSASWKRSHGFGLSPEGKTPGAPHASGAQLARALEQWGSFVAQARPVMEFLSEQIRDSGSIVILSDAQGMLLHALGDTSFADKAARVALRPGAIWHEQWRGTNAIGTALTAGTAVVVHGAEHYLERNAFLTCTAAPIIDPNGQILGALDISGDRLSHHRHTLGLVRSSVRMVEHQLFHARFGHSLQLHLHAQAEGLGTVTEGLLALSETGWIVGANTVALELLGLSRQAIGSTTVETVLGLDIERLLAGLGRAGPAARALRRPDGRSLWARLEGVRHLPVATRGMAAAPGAPAPREDALSLLDTGDGTLQAVIGRARRVLDKPIPLLLQGESGVGKELFAKACHDTGARRRAPFVAVNCAALPETLIEAELFGYRPGAFTGASREGSPGRLREADGGTLFLDEIGDMPLAMQARLLRVLQERQVTPLGGGQAFAVDFQLICATHRKLRDDIDTGRFREDLYYRINGLALQLPALRERTDLPKLVSAVLGQLAPQRGVQLAPDVALAFASFKWPGNLRQLCNVLRTACALLDEHECLIEWRHLPDDVAEELISQPRKRPVEDEQADLRLQAERCIEQTVADCAGNLSQAARRLGISRNTLYRKLKTLQGG
jgi:sigma-54 dependent transcriptional regulator, acetoin dehydrogenase operon transcriptional activator AcoR